MPNSKPPFKSASARAALALAIALALDLREPAQVAQASPSAPANTIAVTNCNDSGAGSLRAAAAAAVDGSTIDMTHLTCSTITLASGSISIAANNVTVAGPGADRLSVRVPAGTARWRNFIINQIAELKNMTIEGGRLENFGPYQNSDGGCINANVLKLTSTNVRNCHVIASAPNSEVRGGAVAAVSATLTNSKVTDSSIYCSMQTACGYLTGGAVYSHGDVSAIDSSISTNSVSGAAFARAGGVFTSGNMSIVRSTISGNSVDGSTQAMGGGIFAMMGLSIDRSTINGNSTNYRSDYAPSDEGGGGVYALNAFGGRLAISQSTLTDNYSSTRAAAVLTGSAPSETRISNSTIARNWAATGSNSPAVIINTHAPLTLSSTIIAQNLQMQSKYELTDLAVSAGTTVSGDHNLIMHSQVSPPGTLTANPELAALADNGGPTATMALPPGSPAIDCGSNPNHETSDQRGLPFPRVAGAAPDIGAFEFRGDILFKNGFESPPPCT